jgi:hypothetical protein
MSTATNGGLRICQMSELPVGERPEPNVQGNVFGCGLLIGPDPDNKLTNFFTFNGILFCKFFLWFLHLGQKKRNISNQCFILLYY